MNDQISSIFRKEDISHEPERMQGANIVASSTVAGNSLTLERAIKFYEELSRTNDTNAKMFAQTSVWLRELLQSPKSKKTSSEGV